MTVGAPAAALLALLYLVAVRTHPGQVADEHLFGALVSAGLVAHVLAAVLRAVVPVLLAGLAGALWVGAAVARRWRAALGAALLVLASTGVSVLLRDVVLSRPALGVGGYAHNTLPSTHVTLSVALCAAAVVLWPADEGRRRTVLLFTVVVGATGLSAGGSVVSYAHRPADAVASALLVVSVGACVAALLPNGGFVRLRHGGRRLVTSPRRTRRSPGPTSGSGTPET